MAPMIASALGNQYERDPGHVGYDLELDVQGVRETSEDKILLEEDDDLIAHVRWRAAGYTVERFLTPDAYAMLCSGIQRIVIRMFKAFKTSVDRRMSLERYHDVIGSRERFHRTIVSRLNRLPLRRLPIDPAVISTRVSEICGVALTMKNPHDGIMGGLTRVFGLRIVRPHSGDQNPLHRDVWLQRLRNAVNIYVPIAGSNERSSLCLVPGSHHWKESEIERTRSGANVNGKRYTVPALISATRPLSMIRPNPLDNEVLVFSPYLIHGGATNFNPDTTRVSLEMRFWRAAGRSSRSS